MHSRLRRTPLYCVCRTWVVAQMPAMNERIEWMSSFRFALGYGFLLHHRMRRLLFWRRPHQVVNLMYFLYIHGSRHGDNNTPFRILKSMVFVSPHKHECMSDTVDTSFGNLIGTHAHTRHKRDDDKITMWRSVFCNWCGSNLVLRCHCTGNYYLHNLQESKTRRWLELNLI